jgi:hypothetical protein
MLIAFAVVGWLLFAATALLYFVGNRINAKDENALAQFGLAVVFSDEVRDATKKGYSQSVIDSPRVDSRLTAWQLGQAFKITARSYYSGEAEVFSPAVVAQAIDKLRAS